MDAIELLKKDHRAVEELFARFNDGGGLTGMVKRMTGNGASPKQRRQLAERICAELDTHARIEEERFYPAVRELDEPELQEHLKEAESEHAQIKERVKAVRAAGEEETALREAVKSLQECVDHHVQEEENEMFPLVEDRMPAGERGRVGRELAARKRAAAPKRDAQAKREGQAKRAAQPKRAGAARGRKTGSRAKPAAGSRSRRMRKTAAKGRKRRAGASAKKKSSGGRRR